LLLRSLIDNSDNTSIEKAAIRHPRLAQAVRSRLRPNLFMQPVLYRYLFYESEQASSH